ncbi:MAG: signal peptidase I [Atopobiaceae bacterium]|jgi:signal peptidase I|nr:signal peptidase I [Atopobiaceae bacterium]MCH4180053.1 signal peptidase I [Atopobiaceae bacterium]MCH4213895.1 signal peptidase I [Atopobiaceae bacterium]MCH4230133.1 signal peptidase I [Atopobiaceae bacterium]MCH4275642.1 signal peptidase I [Atopobiaceae bacterium]
MSDSGHERLSSALEWVLIIVAAVGFALLIRTFVAEPFEIPSGSMQDTLEVGDRILGEKVSYHFRSPQAGDIVTFTDPDDEGTTLIKRVIATEGQTVDLEDGVVYVDGQALSESYTEGKRSDPISSHAKGLDQDVTYPYVVPEGSIWVMGDNRTNSLDSRYFGAIPVSNVTTRALATFWPLSDWKVL